MESMDNIRERIEALEQQMKVMGAHTHTVERRLRWWRGITCGLGLLALVSLAPLSQAADFPCTTVDCLIRSINQANSTVEADTITLEAGTYTLTEADPLSDPINPHGLPIITSPLTLRGANAETTILERAPNAPRFRLLAVAAAGTLTLHRLTVRNGDAMSIPDCFTVPFPLAPPCLSGGGIANAGTLTLTHSIIRDNAADFGGGIANDGTLTLTHSIIRDNAAVAGFAASNGGGGGIINSGDMTINYSTITSNFAGGGGGIRNSGFLEMSTSTVADNRADAGGGILNSGTLTITNSTIARNQMAGIGNSDTAVILNSTIADNGQGIINEFSASATALVWNTIIATSELGPHQTDCFTRSAASPITSLGNNLFGNPMGCGTLRASDLTGPPGLDAFTDDGTPGNGHFPLLPTSQAIDAGNDAVCPRTDQLGRLRIGPCDIGAIEFRHRDQHQHDEEEDHHDQDLAAQ